MKKVIRISLITLGSLLIIAILLPFAFKGKMVGILKDTINDNIEAGVEFSDVSLSLFKHFPHLSIGIRNISVVNHAPFEGDTLASIPSLFVTIDLIKLFKGVPYEIRRIDVKSPDIRLKVLSDGSSNWDIAKEIEDPSDTTASDEEGFVLKIKRFDISKGRIMYDDRSLPIYVLANGLTHTLSGDLSEKKSTLVTKTSAEELSITYDGITYLSKAKARLNSDILADLSSWRFDFTDGEVFINALKILASGWFSMPEEGYLMDVNFLAPGSDFKEALSLVPAVYARDFEQVKTKGQFALSGHVAGLYSEQSMPAFKLGLSVMDASFQYPDLPSAVEDIQIQCEVTNPDGIPDHTIIELSRFHMIMAGAPIDAILFLKTPVSDPDVRASIKGSIKLADMKKIYPLEKSVIEGDVQADVSLEGRLSMIDQKAYEQFKASGQLKINDLIYSSPETPEVRIPAMRLLFSPASIQLEEFSLSSGRTSLSARGELSQYLAYLLRDETIKGSLTVVSPILDINELLGEGQPDDIKEETDKDSTTLTAPNIPRNIDFTLNTQAGEVLFGDIKMEAFKGQVVVRDGRIQFNNVYAKAFDGEIKLEGFYEKIQEADASMNMVLDLKDIDITKAYETAGMMRKLAPIARHTKGKLNTRIGFSGKLDQSLNPVYQSLAGEGVFSTSTIILTGLPVMQQIADAISVKELKESILQPVKASFSFTDGKVEVKPFDIKIQDISANVSGSTGFDQSLAYVMKMTVPRSMMGLQADALISGWVSQASQKGLKINPGSTLTLDILIGGTISKPEVRIGLSGMAESLKEDIQQAITQKVEEIKTEIKQEISKKAEELMREAEKQAASIMEQAKKQADAIKSTAAETAKSVRQEADKQANKIISEGKAKGPITAALAQKAAETAKKEAYDKADALEKEAAQKADALMIEAKRQSDKVLEEGQKKAQAI